MATEPKPNWTQRLLFGVLLVAIISLAGFLAVRPDDKPRQTANTATAGSPASYRYATTPLKTSNATYSLQIADTAEKQQLGLGQRDKLAAGQGMVFPYDQPGQRCFWMKDMRFPIDMIWLDTSKTIVTIEADVSPATYPENFCPAQPAQYVIELNAGEAAKAGLQTGQVLRF